jgi:hypothetical protein
VQRDLPGLIAQVAQMVQDLAQPETEADDTDA